jgi:putative transposase
MPHRKTVQHFHEVGHLHELTFSCLHRMPLLTNDTWREKLARCVEAASREAAVELVGFVFMPEHVHLLVYPTAPNPSIARYLARIKQPFSKQIKGILAEQGSRLLQRLTVLERPGKTCFRFWQEGIGSSLEYIHNNPVQRGLCQHAVDWKWSSARYYLALPARQQCPELPLIHGLPEGSLE